MKEALRLGRNASSINSLEGLPEEVAERVHDFAAVHVDQQSVVPVPHPHRAGRRRRQLVVPRIADPILLAEISGHQPISDLELLIIVAERIVVDADVEG